MIHTTLPGGEREEQQGLAIRSRHTAFEYIYNLQLKPGPQSFYRRAWLSIADQHRDGHVAAKRVLRALPLSLAPRSTNLTDHLLRCLCSKAPLARYLFPAPLLPRRPSASIVASLPAAETFPPRLPELLLVDTSLDRAIAI